MAAATLIVSVSQAMNIMKSFGEQSIFLIQVELRSPVVEVTH